MHKDSLYYLGLSSGYGALRPEDFVSKISVNLITNFTDEILKRIFVGMALDDGIYPAVHAAPYKQYHLYLKNFTTHLAESAPDVTFVFFDVNAYVHSEFHADQQHFAEVLQGLREYCSASSGIVVINSFVLPYRGAYGNLHAEDPLYRLIRSYNNAFEQLANEHENIHIFDINAIVHAFGEMNLRDFRGLYSFDTPFSTDFAVLLCREWLAYVRTILGRVRKCIVVDLDNTLWGGVVGELGPLGVELGPTYPGNAYQNFQRALLEFSRRGVILAINSRNNMEDVLELFEKNPHMLLKEEHFAAIRANWDQKHENLRSIAEELNIGLDSMVFIDDDPFNRELVRNNLPEVFVPDFTLRPEEYARELFSWSVFNQFTITDEDRQKTNMYAEERQRKEVLKASPDLNEYIAGLKIVIEACKNDRTHIARIAQLTQKTNQFNLTTHRYTEAEIAHWMDEEGSEVYVGNVADRFGSYGMALEAIITRASPRDAVLDTFLMSCRTMGRGIEFRFLDYVIRDLAARGIVRLEASFIPTSKNKPAEGFLPQMSFMSKQQRDEGGTTYELDITSYLANPPSCINQAIAIT